MLCLIAGVAFGQYTGKTTTGQQDKTLIKKQSGELTDDRAAFIKQYNGTGGSMELINSQEQSSYGIQILTNGDFKKYDLSKIRQIDPEKDNALFREGVFSKQYMPENNDNFRSDMSRTNAGYLYIEQFGKDNSANMDVREKSNSFAGQYGDDNKAQVKASSGIQNQSRILQTEDKNLVNIKQQDAGNNTIINQYKGDNKARISQKGSQNWVDIDQSEGSELDIKQEGSKNVIRGTRSSWAESLNGSILEIEQYGSNNQVDLQQNGSRVELKQKGINNKTTIIQK